MSHLTEQQPDTDKVTVPRLLSFKERGRKIVMLTGL